MKALSIRAPWWWFILHGGKDVENRDWWTSYIGPLLIHASAWWNHAEVAQDLDSALMCAGVDRMPDIDLDRIRAAGGYIVGRATLTRCVGHSLSPWFFGRNGFLLADPIAFKRPIPFKGKLHLFDVPDELIAQAETHLTSEKRRQHE